MAARTKRSQEMVKWISETLAIGPEESSIKCFDDLKSGIHILQLVHSIAPMSFDLARVDFLASTEYHYEKNWKLCQEVMEKNDINRDFIIERLSQGEKQRDLYMFVSYLHHHYDTLKEQRQPSETDLEKAPSPEKRAELELQRLPYDPYAERKRALDRRKKNSRPARKAGGMAFDTRSMSESSQISAFSSYSTRGMLKKVRFKTSISAWVENLPAAPLSARRCSTPGSIHSDAGGSASGTPMRRDGNSPINGNTPRLMGPFGGSSNENVVSGCGAAGSSSSSVAVSPNHPQQHPLVSASAGGSFSYRSVTTPTQGGTPRFNDATTNAAKLLVDAALKSGGPHQNETNVVEVAPPPIMCVGTEHKEAETTDQHKSERGGVPGSMSRTLSGSPMPQKQFTTSTVGTMNQPEFTSTSEGLMTTGPSSSSLASNFGAGLPTTYGPQVTGSTLGASANPGSLGDDHFLREVIMMDAVECPGLGGVGTHFWSFEHWPKVAIGPTGCLQDTAGDRVHKLFSYDEVKRSAKARQQHNLAIEAAAREEQVLDTNQPMVVKEGSSAWEFKKESVPAAETTSSRKTRVLTAAVAENCWNDFDAMMEEFN